MSEKGKIVGVIVASLFIIFFFISIYITVEETIPDNTVVVVTLEDKLFHSIHFDHICVAGKTVKTMTLSEALRNSFKPHPHCQDLGYFKGNRRFLFHDILSKLGMEINSRWDKNGNWLW